MTEANKPEPMKPVLAWDGHQWVRAMWVPKFTEDAGFNNDWCEYNELDDTYYLPEGWYERQSHSGDALVWHIDCGVTDWRGLPPPPSEAEYRGPDSQLEEKTMDKDEALKLASEALKTYHYTMIDAGVLDRQGVLDQGFTAWSAVEKALAQPATQCTRSHPHETMDAMCELRTEIARLTNENARLKAQPAPVQEPVLKPLSKKWKWVLHGSFADVAGFDEDGIPSFYWQESVTKFKSAELSVPCKGKNCGSMNGWLHSVECRAEHEAQYTTPPSQPSHVPLTLPKIRAMWGSENGLEDCDLCKFDDFVKVVRFIESASGISSTLPAEQPEPVQPVAWNKPTDAMVEAATNEYDEWSKDNQGTTECIRAMLVKAMKAAPPAAQQADQREWTETACALIKAADDAAADWDYMLDSTDPCVTAARAAIAKAEDKQ